jgi:hypothetical protein
VNPVTIKELLDAWRRNMLATKEELEVSLDDISAPGNPEVADESYCVSKLSEWQSITLFATRNTYEVIPYLVRLEECWLESTLKSNPFLHCR